jgi:hypothetical protein
VTVQIKEHDGRGYEAMPPNASSITLELHQAGSCALCNVLGHRFKEALVNVAQPSTLHYWLKQHPGTLGNRSDLVVQLQGPPVLEPLQIALAMQYVKELDTYDYYIGSSPSDPPICRSPRSKGDCISMGKRAAK